MSVSVLAWLSKDTEFYWREDVNQGHREFPFWKRKIPPAKEKNSREFPFGKMLDFTRSNTISTQTSNIYLNQLQWYGQFAEVYKLLEVLKDLEIYPNVTNSFPSVPHVETDRQRSITVVSTNAPRVRTDVPRTLPSLPPLRQETHQEMR